MWPDMDELIASFAFEAWLLWAYACWGVGVVTGIFIAVLAWRPRAKGE